MEKQADSVTGSLSVVQNGCRVIFQRKEWCKECVVGIGKSLMISKMKTKTDDVVGLPFGTMVEWNKQLSKFERLADEIVEDHEDMDFEEGGDNRNLVDDGTAQSMTTEEIAELKSQGMKGMDLISSLIQNSSTFGQRQEYAKKKYVEKKKDRHIYRFRILRPTLRLICEVYNCQKSKKINHLRIDTLAIMLSMSNIYSGSRVIVVDGSQGILLAAAMERTAGSGQIVHIHPGPQPIIPAYDMFGFPDEWTNKIFHLSVDNLEVLSSKVQIVSDGVMDADNQISEPPLKKRKLSVRQLEAATFIKENPMDSLIIASKLHPKSILLFLLPFMKLSGNFAVHSTHREILVDTFTAVRGLGGVVRVCLNETFLRNYQVLEDRTHPENTMSGSGGYLLSGTVVETGARSLDPEFNGSVSEEV